MSVTRSSSTTSTPATPLGVLVDTPPEFEGETVSTPTSQQSSAASPPPPPPPSPPIAGNPKFATVPLTPVRYLEEFHFPAQSTVGLIEVRGGCDPSDVDRLEQAYLNFFNHVRYRNGWESPPFSKEEVLPLLEDAARLVTEVRAHLDRLQPSTKLRCIDGEAQKFLHTPKAAAMVKDRSQHSEFVKELVVATFQDARGFVEGLSRSKLERKMAEIWLFLNNPQVRALHRVHELWQLLSKQRLPGEVAATTTAGSRPPAQEEAPKRLLEDADIDAALDRHWQSYCPADDDVKKWQRVCHSLEDAIAELKPTNKNKKK